MEARSSETPRQCPRTPETGQASPQPCWEERKTWGSGLCGRGRSAGARGEPQVQQTCSPVRQVSPMGTLRLRDDLILPGAPQWVLNLVCLKHSLPRGPGLGLCHPYPPTGHPEARLWTLGAHSTFCAHWMHSMLGRRAPREWLGRARARPPGSRGEARLGLCPFSTLRGRVQPG